MIHFAFQGMACKVIIAFRGSGTPALLAPGSPGFSLKRPSRAQLAVHADGTEPFAKVGF